jgi:putative toxin-antitoxin system antitoxin component (TIGR02293 family)
MATRDPRRRPRPGSAAPLHPSLQYVYFLGLAPADPIALVSYVTKGLSFTAFEKLQHATALTAQQIAETLGIPSRTLHRRKDEGRLQSDESDKLVRLSRVYGQTLELFEGSQSEAKHWLESPQSALGGASPLSMASTEVGAREVEALIGRLEHGVFA